MNLPRIHVPVLVCLLLTVGMIPLVQAACIDTSPDHSYCGCLYNLMPENVVPPDTPRIHGPTVVDINVTTGNLLVRGPLPLIVRNGTGNDPVSSPCMNSTDWHFAYDELNTTIITSPYRPAYFTDLHRTALDQALGTFSLSEYELIVFGLIKNTGADNAYLTVEIREFGGSYSTCSAPLVPGTIRGQEGYLVWSPVGFCQKAADPADQDDACSGLLFNSTDEFCSYSDLIGKISLLMQERAGSGKKRLIYYHCVQGTDRTGGVTIGYLLKNYPKITYLQAVTYAQYMGKTTPPPHYGPPMAELLYLSHAYCTSINGSCALSLFQMESDASEPPFMTLVHPGGESGVPLRYLFDEDDDTEGSGSLADTTIHAVHVIPKKTVVEPILRVERSPRIGEEKKLAGRIFARYYDIDLLNVPDAAVDPSTIEFSVREGYLRDLRIASEDVVMLRWEQDRWVELPTVLDQVVKGRAFYSAETPGFSFFVITNRVPAPPATPEEPASPTIPVPAQETPPPDTPSPQVQLPAGEPRDTRAPAPAPEAGVTPPSGFLLPALVVIAVLGIGGGYLVRRWWIHRQNPGLFRKND